ncbi:Uncharacterised protein [Streptococcus pyogenes]|nr:Uncharacterised protein [Streptococcus pyogenes]
MTDNEKLIEEARRLPDQFRAAQLSETQYLEDQALAELDAVGYGAVCTASRLADALEAAEKALGEATDTPTAHEVTSDDREALLEVLGPILHLPISEIRDRIVASDVWRFRRSEKVHTPTDDEVNAVALAYWGPSEVYDREKLRAALASFRRSEVPEPSAEGYAEFEDWEQEMFRHQPVLSMADGSIAGCQCLDRVFLKGREDWGTHLASVITARLPKPQGEPSDAHVGAAMNAAVTYYEAQGYTMRPEGFDFQAMRAALRAASAVTEQGENR